MTIIKTSEAAKSPIINIGVVGYSTANFDQNKAKKLVKEAFDNIEQENKNRSFAVVSGLTDMGIPALAYREAKKRGWKTIGVACEKAKEHFLFDCDEVHIVGKEWGDESKVFLSKIDYFVKIGGGKQSQSEKEQAHRMHIPVYVFDLEEKK